MRSPPVDATVSVLQWAAQRARLSDDDLKKRFPKWPLWLDGKAKPTLAQLESFAKITHVPFGYFFLPKPPKVSLPIADLRTVGNAEVTEPSSELLKTIYLCQLRQEWFHDYAKREGLPEVPFVGSVQLTEKPEAVAARMRETLELSVEARRNLGNRDQALRHLIRAAEDKGVLVMASSVVGGNPHRPLDVQEFRGFALADKWAPLVFVNAADSKAAQMFTLAHELAHLWLGKSGVSDAEVGRIPDRDGAERWCNLVAAELLMPLAEARKAFRKEEPIPTQIERLANEFKVSRLVALRRIFDAGFIRKNEFETYYDAEVRRLREPRRRGSGGDFYRTLFTRTGERFAYAVVADTLEGKTLFRDAFRLLAISSTATFKKVAEEVARRLKPQVVE